MFAFGLLAGFSINAKETKAWSFVSIPDFLNFDIEYPQKGWEDALGFIVGSMKEEDPAFAMVAGDLVMGHWGTKEEEINKWADKYYPGWVHGSRIMTSRSTPLSVTMRSGIIPGEEPPRMPFPFTRMRFGDTQNANGPDHMKGTAFYWVHKNALFVSVDVFEKGKSNQGEIAAGVTGKQLEWFEKVLRENGPKADHIIVMGHTPILRPVRPTVHRAC